MFVHVYILSMLDARCTRLRWQDKVNGRLRSCRDGNVGVWSQFNALTGSVLLELPLGLRQTVSGAQVATLYHTSLSVLKRFCTAVSASNFPLQNIHLHIMKPSFFLTWDVEVNLFDHSKCSL